MIAVSEPSSLIRNAPTVPGHIDHIKEAGSAFDGYRQIIRSGTARRSSVEQNHGAVISDRVTGDAGAQIVGDVRLSQWLRMRTPSSASQRAGL